MRPKNIVASLSNGITMCLLRIIPQLMLGSWYRLIIFQLTQMNVANFCQNISPSFHNSTNKKSKHKHAQNQQHQTGKSRKHKQQADNWYINFQQQATKTESSIHFSPQIPFKSGRSFGDISSFWYARRRLWGGICRGVADWDGFFSPNGAVAYPPWN